MKILRFKNNEVPLLARVVEQGEGYGRNFSINHDKDEPMIEFYDARYKMTDFQKDGIYLGQFISRYNMSTFEGVKTGIFLDSGSIDWSITADNVKMLQEWSKEQLSLKKEIEGRKLKF